MSLLGSVLGGMFGKAEVSTQHVAYEEDYLDIGHVKGHDNVKVGLLIAATGRHNVLLVGPPGEGKSTIVSTMPGFVNTLGRLIEVGPNITESGLLGGGRTLHHGAITDAHNGMLFMDELPQYDRALLESLRTPMESGEINVARGGTTRTFPCNFQLLAAMNPCPCGHYPTDRCTCTQSQVQRYLGKLSGPILDRIDMFMYMDAITVEDRFLPSKIGQSQSFKLRVEHASQFRVQDRAQHYYNKEIRSKDIYNPQSDILRWSAQGLESFKEYIGRKSFSTRKGVRLARLSRSMADLMLHTNVTHKHLLMVDEYLNPPVMI